MIASVQENRRKRSVVLVGPKPPPVQGPAAMLMNVADRVSEQDKTIVIDVASKRKMRSLAFHLERLFLNVGASLKVLGLRKRSRCLYMTADSQFGIAYNCLVAAAGRLAGYQVFLHHQAMAYCHKYNPLQDLLCRILGPEATHVVICGGVENGMRRLYPSAIRFSRLGTAAVVPPEPHARHRLRRPFKIGFLRNLIVEKGLDQVIDLVIEGRQRGLPPSLVLAGKSFGSESDAELKRAAMALGDDFEYRGAIPEKDKGRFFAAVDVFAFPSRYINEVQPRAISEALARGVPVFTADIGGVAEMVNNRIGLCAPPESNFLEHALRKLQTWHDDLSCNVAAVRAAEKAATEQYADGKRMRDLVAGLVAAA